jgi:glycosyltransferase involved in cell wall biosynthesis
MNIIYFAQYFYPAIFGGGELLFFLLSRELSRKGHKVYVITQNVKELPTMEISGGVKIFRVGPELTTSLKTSIRDHVGFLIYGIRKAREIILESKKNGEVIDILHSGPYTGIICGHICSKFYGIPHVATLHDVYQASDKEFWKEWMSKEIKSTPFYTSFIAKLLENITLRLNVSAFHTVSEMSKIDLTNFGVNGNKISIVSPGLDLSEYWEKSELMNLDTLPATEVDSRSPYAVFMGRLIHYKNVQTVIMAFKEVVKILPNVELVIIGDGPYKESLTKIAMDIKKNVRFTGRIAEVEKITLIKNSSFILFPSLIEGFGVAAIEGFACGKPVLVADVRPLSDIVKDGYSGYLISPLDINAWSEKIIYLFKNKAKQIEMGSNAFQQFLLNHDLQKTISKMEELYRTLVQTKNRNNLSCL